VPAEQTQREPNVLSGAAKANSEALPDSQLSTLLFARLDRTHRETRGPSSGLRGQAGLVSLLDFTLQMVLQLFVQFPFGVTPVYQRPD
jgi:hypothetical protein